MRRLCWIIGLLSFAADARAEGESLLVIESYVGDRPDDADRMLDDLFVQLEHRGHIARQRARTLIHERLSAGSRAASTDDAAAMTRLSQEGFAQYAAEKFDGAEKSLSAALDLVARYPDLVLQNPKQRGLYHQSAVALALILNRSGQTERAVELMKDVARTFPAEGAPKRSFGAEAVELYNIARGQLLEGGKGSLELSSHAEATIFLNERFVGLGSAALEDLLPGRYRVVTLFKNRVGRVHSVEVRSSAASELAIDAELDGNLETIDYIGFRFSSDAEREARETDYARRLGNAADADGVILLSIDGEGETREMHARLLFRDASTAERRGSLALGPPSADEVRAFASSLLDTRELEMHETSQESESSPGRSKKLIGLALGGSGLLFLGTGVVFIAIDKNEVIGDERQMQKRNSAPLGLAFVGAGIAAAAVGGYLFWQGHEESGAAQSAFVMPYGDGVSVGLAGEF